MEKSDFLNYRALAMEVRQLRGYRDALERSLDAAPSPQYSHTPKAPPSGGSALEARVLRLIEVKDLYKSKLAEQIDRLLEVERAIGSLEAPEERLVMRLRYIEGRSWTNVCMLLQREGYSERQVYYIHGAALRKLKEV